MDKAALVDRALDRLASSVYLLALPLACAVGLKLFNVT